MDRIRQMPAVADVFDALRALLPGYPQQLPEMLILPWERENDE